MQRLCRQCYVGCHVGQHRAAPYMVNNAINYMLQRDTVIRSCSKVGQGQPHGRTRKAEWVRQLEEDAGLDEDIAQLLEGTDGDETKIREKMRDQLSKRDLFVEGQGVEAPPKISFRNVDPFNLWLWFEFARGEPTRRELDLLQTMIQAWFMVGKMGGYNSQNMQVYYRAGEDQSFFEYDNDEAAASQGSLLHDCSELESQGTWARCRVDLGSCDELSLDVLLNMLVGFSHDVSGLSRIIVGGKKKEWPVPDNDTQDENAQFDIDPMQLPEGLDDDIELLDTLEKEGVLRRRKGSGSASDDSSDTSRTSKSRRLSTRFDTNDDTPGDDEGSSQQSGSTRKWGDGFMRRYSQEEFRKMYPNR